MLTFIAGYYFFGPNNYGSHRLCRALDIDTKV